MKIALSSLLFLAVAVVATADNIDWSKHQWIAPTVTDLRGPCPGLNTLANHGFLPRDGKNLTIATIIQAGIDGYNIQPDVLILAAKVGLLTSAALDTFTLQDLRLHNSIEHDASISRMDFALGDNSVFNETVFTTLANANPGVDYYNATSAGEVQRLRLLDSQTNNPQLINTGKEITIRTRESSLYLSVMGDVLTGVAPKNFVQIFFREERLPIEEGWKRSTTPITRETLDPIADVIEQASQWSPDSQCPSIVLTVASNTTTTL